MGFVKKISNYPRMLGFILAFSIVTGTPYVIIGEINKAYFIDAALAGLMIFPLMSFLIYYFLDKNNSFNCKKFSFGLNVGNFLALLILLFSSVLLHMNLSLKETDIFSWGMILSVLLGWFLRAMYIHDEHKGSE